MSVASRHYVSVGTPKVTVEAFHFRANCNSVFRYYSDDFLCWILICPLDNKKAPKKENNHRAMDDIKESIAELKYYKENIFKASQSRKWLR